MSKKKSGTTIDSFYDMKQKEQKKSPKKNRNSPKKTSQSKKKNTKKQKEEDAIDLSAEIVIGMQKQIKQEKKQKTPKKKKSIYKKKRTKKEQEAFEKTKKSIQTGCKWGTFLGLLLGTTIYIILSPLFDITVIEVIGNSRVNREKIIALSGIQTETNTFQINKNEAKENIKQEEPYIENIVISRKLPNTIVIEIQERKATYMLEFASGYVYLNNQGYLLEVSEEKLEIPIIKGFTTTVEEIAPGKRLNVEDLLKLEDILKISETAKRHEIYNMITYFDISDKFDYILDLEECHAAHFGEVVDINTKILYLKEINIREKGIRGTILLNKTPVIFQEAI